MTTSSALDLARAATHADGVEPFNEATRIALREGDEARVRVEREGAVALGFGDAPVELVVHPDRRRSGLGRDLVAELAGRGEHRFWAHGDLPGAQALAAAAGLAPERTLLVLRLALGEESPQERVPDGVTLRTFRPTTPTPSSR